VVGRVKHDSLDSDPRIVFYLPHSQFPARTMSVVLNSQSGLRPLTSAVKSLTNNLDPEIEEVYGIGDRHHPEDRSRNCPNP
jgi:hypothetical protein